MAAVGVGGVILKASQGLSFTDPSFVANWNRAHTVFGYGCVHAYHFLDGSDPVRQMDHFLAVLAEVVGPVFPWLDFEEHKSSQASKQAVLAATHYLQGRLGYWPGVYGPDLSFIGPMLDEGHFGPCPKWIARPGHQPVHHCDLYQWQFGEDAHTAIQGCYYDISEFRGAGTVKDWMRSLGVKVG